MSSGDSTQLFPHPRRIVTGHRPDGTATVLSDNSIPCERKQTGSNYAVLWEASAVPTNCSGDGPNGEFFDPIIRGTKSLANDKGVILRVVDFPPGQKGVSILSPRFHVSCNMECSR